jgi:hypothetical protein
VRGRLAPMTKTVLEIRHHHAKQHLSWPAHQARDIVGAQELLPRARNRSFTHLAKEMFLETAAEGARCSGVESSINDLHVWSRSFRVKLSRLVPSSACCAR